MYDIGGLDEGLKKTFLYGIPGEMGIVKLVCVWYNANAGFDRGNENDSTPALRLFGLETVT